MNPIGDKKVEKVLKKRIKNEKVSCILYWLHLEFMAIDWLSIIQINLYYLGWILCEMDWIFRPLQ